MKILITGNLGYIGTVLGSFLSSRDFEIHGIDAGYYRNCFLHDKFLDTATTLKDIRDLEISDIEDFDAIVHLAALSNDPIGALNAELTYEINRDAAISLALKAKKAGVARFVFISSQSIYGISNSSNELVESDVKNPQTAYAKSKWDAEKTILRMSSHKFTAIALRPSTVFGWSPRLRSDIVFNNLLLSGFTKGVIVVHSDGSPWRPIVHVTDICEAIRLALIADVRNVSGEAFNIGKIGGNYTVREIAQAAATCLGKIEILFNTEKITDPRTYRVSFDKAEKLLGFKAKRDLVESGLEMLENFRLCNLANEDIMGRLTNRLAQMTYLKQREELDETLRFR